MNTFQDMHEKDNNLDVFVTSSNNNNEKDCKRLCQSKGIIVSKVSS
jgi:hypothetical protein